MGQKTILIVEDYDDTREMIAQVLRGKGFRVVEGRRRPPGRQRR